MNISSLMAAFNTGTYTVTRQARGLTTRGRTQTGTTTTLSVDASVSPATGADLKRLPEGRRANATKLLFTTTQLFIGEQGGAFEADTVSIGGEDWEVQHVATWTDPVSGDTGYSCLVQLVA